MADAWCREKAAGRLLTSVPCTCRIHGRITGKRTLCMRYHEPLCREQHTSARGSPREPGRLVDHSIYWPCEVFNPVPMPAGIHWNSPISASLMPSARSIATSRRDRILITSAASSRSSGPGWCHIRCFAELGEQGLHLGALELCREDEVVQVIGNPVKRLVRGRYKVVRDMHQVHDETASEFARHGISQ